MRFIQGETFKEAIRRFHEAEKAGPDAVERAPTLRQLLTRFVAVCNAVAYAHSRGILHRDLKPSNIMLGKYGETLVVDWGLAKAIGRIEVSDAQEAILQPRMAKDAAATQRGAALGTPAYMSPEQAAGRLEELGVPSDVYSLGATLYTLLTGQAPVQGRNSAEVLQKVRQGDWRPPRAVKRDVPAALDVICRKAMALSIGDRYSSALSLAADVEHWLADEPIAIWREPWTGRASRWLRRHGTLVTGVLVAVLLATVSMSLTGISSSEMSRAQYFGTRAVRYQTLASDQWNFFQAKRIRGTEMENTVELLGAIVRSVPVTRETLAEAAARLPEDFDHTVTEADRLLKTLDTAKGGSSTGSKALRQAAKKLRESAAKQSTDAKALQKRLDAALADPEVQEALGYLRVGLPEVTKQPVGDERVREARYAIDARKPETDTAPLMVRITDRELGEAMEAAEANAIAFDAKSKPLDRALDQVAKVLDEQAQLAAALRRAAAAVSAAMPGASIDGGNPTGEIHAAAKALEQTTSAAERSTRELVLAFGAGRRGYTARRYEREARDNQEIAGIYEIQVRRNNWLSERHRQRSVLFFFALLFAQTGVIISAIALAVKDKGLLWGLAGLAGAAAVFFGAYVYLFM
jgi:hypothetical protein